MDLPTIIEDWDLQAREEHDPEPLIDGILWKDDRALLVAPQKTGKSIVALQIARCIAGGVNFVGFETPQPRTVLYLSGEGDIGELKARSKEMGELIPTEKDRLFYWPIPQYPLNKPEGFKELLAVGEALDPDLTILDPAYALMKGNMKEDEDVGDLVRNLNLYQQAVDSALLITHHSHRPKRTEHGQKINEGDDAYYGNFLFSAWPKRIYLLELVGKERSRRLSCSTYRNTTGLNEPIDLTLVEPSPLILNPRVDGWSGSMWQVWYHLDGKAISKPELVEMVGKSRQAGYEAVNKLESLGFIHDTGEGMYIKARGICAKKNS